MKIYKITLFFGNLDNSLYTDYQATMTFEVQADHKSHAELLAQRLEKTLKADNYLIN